MNARRKKHRQAKRKKLRGCCFAVRDFLLRYPATPEQAVVLLCLSVFAQADGSRIYPGRDNLLRLARIRSAEMKPAIDHWLTLKVLVLVAESRPKHAAEYRIDLARMTELLGSTTERSANPNSVPKRNGDKARNSVPNSVPEASHSVPEGSPLGSAVEHQGLSTFKGESLSKAADGSDGVEFEYKQSSSSETGTTKTDDDDVHVLEKDKIEKLYHDHPRFVELCSRIVLRRAEEMHKRVASPALYVRGALPSLLREPDLLTEISFGLGDDFKDAWPLYQAATKSFFGEPQSKPATVLEYEIQHEVQAEISQIHRMYGKGSAELERSRTELATRKVRARLAGLSNPATAPKREIHYATSEYGPPGKRSPEVQAEISRLHAEYKAKQDPMHARRRKT